MSEPPLRRYESNVTSQCGEDGVIAHALDVVGELDRWCVEFGAWDGRHASNTYSLIHAHGYSAVLIEGDARKFEELRRTHANRSKVTTLNRLVSFEGPGRLDGILAATQIPRDFDLLSIDIDGNDFHVWEALTEYRPKIVVIEYNPTIPNEVDFVQPRDMTVTQGSSITAMARLARAKGYRLIHATVVNAIFVDERYFPRFGIADDSPAALRGDLSLVSWLFETYDGRLHVAGYGRMRYHDVAIRKRRLQMVPRALRTFPANFSRLQRIGYRVWKTGLRR